MLGWTRAASLAPNSGSCWTGAPHRAAAWRSEVCRSGIARRGVRPGVWRRIVGWGSVCVCACVRAHVALAAPVLIKPALSPRVLQFVSTNPRCIEISKQPTLNPRGCIAIFRNHGEEAECCHSRHFSAPFFAVAQQMGQMSISTWRVGKASQKLAFWESVLLHGHNMCTDVSKGAQVLWTLTSGRANSASALAGS